MQLEKHASLVSWGYNSFSEVGRGFYLVARKHSDRCFTSVPTKFLLFYTSYNSLKYSAAGLFVWDTDLYLGNLGLNVKIHTFGNIQLNSGLVLRWFLMPTDYLLISAYLYIQVMSEYPDKTWQDKILTILKKSTIDGKYSHLVLYLIPV